MRPLFFAILCLMTAPVYAQTTIETALEAPGPNGVLGGTLLSVDAASTPPVLIIPGSGPTDRNGDSPMGIKASTYRLLAEGLAAEGIATLRIDKRGLFGSAAAIPDPDAVTIGAYAQDVNTWTAVLRQRTGTPCAWLLGHSEGGLVALAAAHAEAVCGLILVATPGRPLGETLREQLRANPANAPILAEAERAIDRLEAKQPVDAANMHPALVPLFRPSVQGFLIDAFAYDPAALLADVEKPVLILQGGRDLQVPVTDAERLKAAKPDATLRLIADANHVLKTVAGDDLAANLATYGDPDLPLADGINASIVTFIRSHPVKP